MNKCRKIEAALKKCGHSCPTDGGWGEFGDWSKCSVECGGGVQTRSRSCDNPAPAHGGADCKEDAEESQGCNMDACPTAPTVTTGMYFSQQEFIAYTPCVI